MKLQGKQIDFINLVKKGTPYIFVEAPAGTGKTYSSIQAAKLLAYTDCFKSGKVLVLTFSRNARGQLLKEFGRLKPDNFLKKKIEINNYHSFFKSYIDSYCYLLGFKCKPNLVDEEEFDELIQLHYPNLSNNIHSDILEDYFIENNELIKINNSSSYKINKKISKNNIIDYLKMVESFSKETGYICFSHFGYLIYKIIKISKNLSKHISHDYPVLILDEYQDTNYFQDFFIDSVLKYSKGIFFGDSLQMIYEFRGSNSSRLNTLTTRYPGIVKIEFDEYFRYKDKKDIIELLSSIRQGIEIDYKRIINGKVINIDVPCNEGWYKLKSTARTKKSQCAKTCYTIAYELINKYLPKIPNCESTVILCHTNDEVEYISKVLCDTYQFPKVLNDNKSLSNVNKLLKKLIRNDYIEKQINLILSILCEVTIKKTIENEKYNSLINLDWKSFNRKRKGVFKELKELLKPYKTITDLKTKTNLIFKSLRILIKHKYQLNLLLIRYIKTCLSIANVCAKDIDDLMIQRQYINSFSDISAGLYITTIHQSKGKEFDNVFIFDVNRLKNNRNLMYVSHSRMKKRVFPIVINYLGLSY